jgi:hypothetical protein
MLLNVQSVIQKIWLSFPRLSMKSNRKILSKDWDYLIEKVQDNEIETFIIRIMGSLVKYGPKLLSF